MQATQAKDHKQRIQDNGSTSHKAAKHYPHKYCIDHKIRFVMVSYATNQLTNNGQPENKSPIYTKIITVRNTFSDCSFSFSAFSFSALSLCFSSFSLSIFYKKKKEKKEKGRQ